MAVGSPPTVRRRQLGRELRRLREEAGLLAEDLAAQLRCSPSRISRIETARIRIGPGTVHEILDALEIDGPRRTRLVDLARDAESPGWWQKYAEVLSYEYATYISLESEAAELRVFEPLIVHGLLQTEEYARAIMAGAEPPRSAAEGDALVAARMTRQAVLRRREPLRLDVVMDESVLHRAIGGADVLSMQLRRLVELAKLPSVTLRVLSFESADPLVYVTSPFVLMEFSDAQDEPVVYIEGAPADSLITRPEAVQRYADAHEKLVARALSPTQSLRKIRSLVGHR